MYFNALNRFIYTCSKKMKYLIIFKKNTLYVRFPNFVQKWLFFKKISRYINFWFRTSVNKSIQCIKINMLPLKKLNWEKNIPFINIMKKHQPFRVEKTLTYNKNMSRASYLNYFATLAVGSKIIWEKSSNLSTLMDICVWIIISFCMKHYC